MKGFYLKRSNWLAGFCINLYSGTHCLNTWCYIPFIKKFPHLKLKPGEKIPVNIKIARRAK